MHEPRPAGRGEELCRGQSGHVPARLLLWSALLLVMVSLGTSWLVRGSGLGDAGLVEEPGGGSVPEGPGAPAHVRDVEAGEAAGAGTTVVVDESSRSKVPVDVEEDAFNIIEASFLEVRIFLGSQPLNHGTVMFEFECLDGVTRRFAARYALLEGTNKTMVRVPWNCPEDKVSFSVQYSRAQPGVTPEEWRFEATVPRPKMGERWIGPDIILKREQHDLVCKGHVMNETGQPIKGGQVGVMVPISLPRNQNFNLKSLDRRITVVSAADGYFEIRDGGRPRGNHLRLDASASGHVPAKEVLIRPGTTNLKIVLERAGSLSGSLVLPVYADPLMLSVGLFAEMDWEKKKERAELVASGTPSGIPSRSPFELRLLRPGRYVLTVGFPSADQPVIVIPGIEIHAGQECKDVRLKDLDLRGRLKAIRVQVRAERKSGPLVATVSVKVSGAALGSSTKVVEVDSFGWARLTIPSSGVDLTVQAQGYKKVQRRRVTDHLRIELEKLRSLPRVEVQIEGGLPKKIPGNIWLELVPSGSGGKRIQARSFSLEGRYYFHDVPSGPYRVRVYLKRSKYQKGNDERSPRMPVDQDKVCQVLNTGKKQLFDVAIDRERLLRFIKDCKRRSKSAATGR